MTIIESVHDFIAECPCLEKLLRIHADFLPARETAYSVEETPVQTIVAQNVDGSARWVPDSDKTGGNIADGATAKRLPNSVNAAFYDKKRRTDTPTENSGRTVRRLTVLANPSIK